MNTTTKISLILLLAIGTGCATSKTQQKVPVASQDHRQRSIASEYEVGDDSIKAGWGVPLYRDLGDLKNKGMTVGLNESAESAGGYHTCSGMISPGSFTMVRSGNCVDVQHVRGRPTEAVRYCEGKMIQADGRKFKLLEVMDRCMQHPRTREDGKYKNLFNMSPIVRLQDEKGQVFITEVLFINPLIEINNSHQVVGTGSCKKARLIGGTKKAKQCAIESAKEYIGELCNGLQGKIQAATVKEESAPWACYTEMFNEEYCATYSAKCDF